MAPSPGRTPALETDRELYARHYAALVDYTDRLREGRCRRTDHFGTRLSQTVAVFDALSGRWNTEILFVLYMQGALRFNVLKRALHGVSSRVLTDKLVALAKDGFVRRNEAATAQYELTNSGSVVARHLHPLVFYLHNERGRGV